MTARRADRGHAARFHLPKAYSHDRGQRPRAGQRDPLRRYDGAKPDPRGAEREDPGACLRAMGPTPRRFHFNKDLYRLVKAGKISKQDALQVLSRIRSSWR